VPPKTYQRSGPKLSFNDWMVEKELEQIARERAQKNGHTERYCDCAELVIAGERAPCPAGHDCDYVRARAELVPIAAARASEQAAIATAKVNGCAILLRRWKS
jgi:hypothetical protein